MKKNLSFTIFFLSISLLTACSSKWDHTDPEMPQDLIEYNQSILEEEFAILEENPEDLNALFEVAFRYQQLGDWKKAVKYYEEVLALTENDNVTLNNLAYIYEEMEDYEMAASYIKRLFEANPTDTEVIKDTVRILLKVGDALNAEHALEYFEELNLNPESPDPEIQKLIDELYDKIYTWAEENSQDVN